MAYGIENISLPRIVGCMDPQASNYNPLATDPCGPFGPPTVNPNGTYTSGCCIYPNKSLTGCMDPQATNYNPNVTINCDDCCNYGTSTTNGSPVLVSNRPVVFNPGSVFNRRSQRTDDPCASLVFGFNVNGQVIVSGLPNSSPEIEGCCNEVTIGQPVTWLVDEGCFLLDPTNNTLCDSLLDGSSSTEEIENRITCVNCNNFAWWDNLYTSLNGDSLQNTDPDLWDFLISVITSDPTNPLNPNFGNGSFYIDNATGQPITNQICCDGLPDSNYVETLLETGEIVSACLCDTIEETELNCECITSVDQFTAIAGTVEGGPLLLNVATLTSLGLTVDQANFVIGNLFNPGDFTGDGIPDSVNAQILIGNVLYVTGGFYLCFQNSSNVVDTLIGGSNQPNTSPIAVNSAKCTDLGGFFDGILCYCNPQEDCNLNFDDIQIVTTLDQYNQQVSVATFNGESLSETCCLQLAEENNLPWAYTSYNGSFQCFTRDPNPCLPLEFNLNRDLIEPECENPLDISVSFYFKTPDNICVEPEEDDDIIIIDPEEDPCLLRFDEENNLIDYNSTRIIRPSLLTPTPGDDEEEINDGKPCCFNPSTPIQTQLVVKDDNDIVVHTSEPFSFIEFETWYDLTTQYELPTTGITEGYKVSLQFTSGLNCCCVYDIFLDNISFSCSEDEVITEIIKDKCPGFDLVPVIDNKKSWVYNPGNLNYSGIRNQSGRLIDNDIINNGELGLIGGYGTINRIFAPSPDADLPWRYTDYFNQSSILEKHSNLVLNSKELYLTFDMCSIGGPCPDGYTLSAGTEICYKYIDGCPDGYTLSGGTCISATTATTINYVTTPTTPSGCTAGYLLSGGTCYSAGTETCNGTLWDLTVTGGGFVQDVLLKDCDNNTYQTIVGTYTAGTYSGFCSTTQPVVNFTTTTSSFSNTGIPCFISTGTTIVTSVPNTTGCTTGFLLSGGTCYSAVTGTTTVITTTNTVPELVTEESNPLACKTKFTLLQLENYKKTFQSFWLNFVEQFIPATTIFISGEKWCNRPDEICTQYEECDFDFEFVEGDVTITPNTNELGRSAVVSQDSNTVDPNFGGLNEERVYQPLSYESTRNGPIDTTTVRIRPLPSEDGETKTLPSVIDNLEERRIRRQNYLKKLQPIQIFA